MSSTDIKFTSDGNFKLVLGTVAENYFVWRKIGAGLSTWKKVTRSFWFIKWTEWEAFPAAANLVTTFTSFPNPAGQRRSFSVTRQLIGMANFTEVSFFSFFVAISFRANAQTDLPDPEHTEGSGGGAPDPGIQKVDAHGTASFPNGEMIGGQATSSY